MGDKDKLMSDAFQVFMKESPKYAQAWMSAVQTLGTATALDKKKVWPILPCWPHCVWTPVCPSM